MKNTDPIQKKQQNHLLAYRIFFLLVALEGAGVFLSLFQGTSEDSSAIWLGFSLPRLVLGGAIIFLTLIFFCLAAGTLVNRSWGERITTWMNNQLMVRNRLPAVLALLVFGFFFSLAVIGLFQTSLTSLLGMLVVVYQRSFLLVLWLGLFCVQAGILLWSLYPSWRVRTFWDVPRSDTFVSTLLITGLLTGFLAHLAVVYFQLHIFKPFFWFSTIGLVSLWISIRLKSHYAEKAWSGIVRTYLQAAAIFCFVFLMYRLTSIWIGHPHTPGKSFFDRLAVSLIEGRLYLKNPDSLHDLTLYKGEWYVANPPLVALLMVPLVLITGPYQLNTVVFSITFGALNTALVYLILEKISERGWTRLRSRANLWLTMLFAFGTVHWYLAIGGKMWFLSQTVTVTLLALAFRVTLEDCKGWLPGMAIALAVAARPNVVMFLPVLLGIVAQSLWEKYGRVHFWKLVRWSAVFFIPVVLAILGMLGYNYARFGDPLDYGYLTENVAGYMADDLKNYGTFHPHFIARNLRVMFLGYPKIGDCGLPVPKHEGMSMLLSTPALLYLAGGIRRKPWVAGMWMGFLSMLIPLVMYYNTGAWQFGYKYLLDMIIPVMALLALAAGDRISWKFRILIMASILISLWGLLWWNGLWCP